MVVQWLCSGCAVVVQWLCSGCAVVVQWLCSGCAVVALDEFLVVRLRYVDLSGSIFFNRILCGNGMSSEDRADSTKRLFLCDLLCEGGVQPT